MRLLPPLLLLLTLPATAAPTLDVSRVRRTEQADWAYMRIKPGAQLTRLEGSVTGLMVADHPDFRVWPSDGTYHFRTGPFAARSAMVVVPEASPLPTRLIHLNQGRKRPRSVHVAFVRGDQGAPVRLTEFAHLVRAKALRMDVGAAHGVLLDRMRVLRPGRTFALPVAATLLTLKARFEAERARQAPAIDAVLAPQRARRPKGYTRDGKIPHERSEAWPTWDQAKGRLVVTFHVKRLRPWLGPLEDQVVGGADCPCDELGNCAPCERVEPVVLPRPKRFVVGDAMGARYEVDRRGRLVNEVIYLPQAAQ